MKSKHFVLPNIELMASTARSFSDSGSAVTGTEVWEEGGAGGREEDKGEELTLTEERRVTHRDISSRSETKNIH